MADEGILQSLSDILSAPRKALWSALGTEKSGKELASDWLGLDPEGWAAGGLGAGLETLGDPMSYLLPAGASFIGKGLRGASGAAKALEAASAGKNLGMTAEELYRYAPKAAGRFLADPGGAVNLEALGSSLPKPVTRFLGSEVGRGPEPVTLASGSKFRKYLNDVSIFRDVKPIEAGRADEILEALAQGHQMPRGHAISSIHPDPITRGIEGAGDAYGWTGRIVNRGGAFDPKTGARILDPNTGKQVLKDPNLSLGQSIFGMQKHSGGELMPGIYGFHDARRANVIARNMGETANAAKTAGETLLHETGHAIVNQAEKMGTTEGLPLAMKLPALLGMGAEKGSFRAGLSRIADEMVQQSLEKKGIPDQILGGAKFLFGEDPGYLKGYLKYNRPSGELFRALLETGALARRSAGGATPLIAGALGGAGSAGLGSAALYNYLTGE